LCRDGKVVEVVESGKVRVGGLFKTDSYFKDVDVVMMDTSPKDSNWQVGELWTNDNKESISKRSSRGTGGFLEPEEVCFLWVKCLTAV